MNRRAFIMLLGGAAWPLAASAQQGKIWHIGALLPVAADDLGVSGPPRGIPSGTGDMGWTIGRNVRIDTRWATNAAEARRHAVELAALRPTSSWSMAPRPWGHCCRQPAQCRSCSRPPPIRSGPDSSTAWRGRGGNATGFMSAEYGTSGKWLELLKQIAPDVTRAAVLRDPDLSSGTGQFAAIQAVAPSLRVELNPVNVRDAVEIERAVAAFARSPNGGLIVPASPAATFHRHLIVTMAARHKLPAVYFERFFVAAGGLVASRARPGGNVTGLYS
jgi:putative ABC transport system substrate-binding protein